MDSGSLQHSTFEDRNPQTCPKGFVPEKNTDAFLAKIPEYAAQVVRAFTLNFQGGQPGYRGAINSACEADGALRKDYAGRVGRVIEACDAQGVLEGAADDPLVHAKMKALAAKKG